MLAAETTSTITDITTPASRPGSEDDLGPGSVDELVLGSVDEPIPSAQS